jgi:phage tail-like protein
MSEERRNEVSSYLAYLPALFQEVGPDGTSILGRLLLAFEEVLTGRADAGAVEAGLEEILDGRLKETGEPDPDTGVQRYFTPGPGAVRDECRAPKEFLDWLAGWVALTFLPGWGEEEKRRLLARIVPLYARRGTLAGLLDFLSTYTGMGVKVLEYLTPFEVGRNAVVGGDFPLGEAPPHYFSVQVVLQGVSPEEVAAKKQIARTIIEQEKPAHTWYNREDDRLFVIPQTIQVGVFSRVGKDTWLGQPK